MYQRVIYTLAITALLGSLAACSSRTAAATQNTVLAGEAPAADEQAVTAVDEMIAALGGAETWAGVKQLRWEVKHMVEGKVTELFRHSWDIWNGRHRFEFVPPEFMEAKEPDFHIAMYDLFDRNGGFVSSSKAPNQKAGSAETARVVELAYKVWLRDHYQISMFYKLRDPGVYLSYAGERQDFYDTCKNTCIDVKVSFAPQVGSDEYHVLINKDTKVPEVVEKAVPGGNVGIQIVDWAEAGGLKFPKTMKNLGADESFVIDNVAIGAPDDSLYVPTIGG